MKTRIVERKRDDGRLYYVIQYRRFWRWNDYYIDYISCSKNCVRVSSKVFAFNTIEQAQDAVKRASKTYSHKDIAIYPTYNEGEYYSLFGAEKHLNAYMEPYYTEFIFGTFAHCCYQIEERLKAEKNRKYQRRIK